MAIAPDSASYPVLGAAQAAGIDYGLAQQWTWAKDTWASARVEAQITALYGEPARLRFTMTMLAAWRAGRVRIRKLGWCA